MLQQLGSLNGMELPTKQFVCQYNFRFLACHFYFTGQSGNYMWGVVVYKIIKYTLLRTITFFFYCLEMAKSAKTSCNKN